MKRPAIEDRVGGRGAALRAATFLVLGLAMLTESAQAGTGEDTRGSAQHGGLLIAAPDDASTQWAPVLGSFIEVAVEGPLAVATLTQLFSNPRDEVVEATYLFPLPDGAAVDGVRLTVGGRTLEGVVLRIADARADYDAARTEGRRAALVAHAGGNVFRTQVANLAPGETVEVALTFRQVVRFRDGAFRLRVPLVAAPVFLPTAGLDGAAARGAISVPAANAWPRLPAGEVANPVALRVLLAPGWPIATVDSPSHRLDVRTLADGRTIVQLADEVVPADGDLVLAWSPQRQAPPISLLLEAAGDSVFALISVVPPDTPAVDVARETVFVLDTSGSMRDALPRAIRALARAIHDLRPQDRLNVIRFASDVTSVFPEARPASAENVEAALRFLGDLEAEGGTEIGLALGAALNGAVSGELRQVVFFTDGAIGGMPTLLRLIRARIGSTRLFTVGIGAAPNARFMRRAAEAGRGSYTFVEDVAHLDETIDGLSARLAAPKIVDLTIDWDDPGADVQPQAVRDLFADEAMVVVAKLARWPRQIVLRGILDGEAWEARLDAAGARQATGVAKLWAERKVEVLGDAVAADEGREAAVAEIEGLGLEHQIATPFTSLVVVDHEHVVGGGAGAPRRAVPMSSVHTDSSSYSGFGVEEIITLTAESPLLDERKLAMGTSVSQLELDRLPASDLWSSVAWSRVVESARSDVAPRAAGGSTAGDTAVRLDGAELTSWNAPALARALLPLRRATEELRITAGSADPALGTAGLEVDVTTRRGSNVVRGSAHWQQRAGGAAADVAGTEESARSEAAAEAGGPMRRDRAWAWGTLGRSESARHAVGGLRDETRSEAIYGKLAALASDRLSLTFSAGAFDGRERGADAGPLRTESALTDTHDAFRLGRLSAAHVFSSSFYIEGALEASTHDERRQPLASTPRTVDARGVEDGAAPGLDAERRRSGGELDGNRFAGLGATNHDIGFGGRWLETSDHSMLKAPGAGRVVRAGGALGLEAPMAVLEHWRDGLAQSRLRRAGLWLRDVLTIGSITASAGLRYDDQTLTGAGWRGPQWRRVSPRLSLTAALGDQRKTLVRAAYGRFSAPLRSDLASRLDPRGPARSLSRFADASGDLVLDASEAPSLLPWTTIGFDPRDPGAAPAMLDPSWSGPLTDELTAAVERSFGWIMVVRLEATWRTIDGLGADRLLVRGADGVVRPATASDYQLVTQLSGAVPGAAGDRVPVFDLLPGVASTGRSLIGGGDRSYRYRRLGLGVERRLSGRWAARGHLSWSAGRWRIGRSFLDARDPTADAAVADRPDDLLSGDPAAAPGWSLLLSSIVELPRRVHLAAVVHGRQGDRLRYSRSIARAGAGIVAVQLSDARRLDDRLTVDLHVDKDITLGGVEFTCSAEVFNLFDEQTVTALVTDLGLTTATATLDSLPARSLRVGVRVRWR